jgi:drug/metabolite transporter (DMT)-like permease
MHSRMTATSATTLGLKTLGLTAVAMCAFAANSIFCRLALAQTTIDPATFTVVRIAAGALILSALSFVGGRRSVGGSWSGAAALLGYAACFSVAYVSLTAATGALLLFGAVQATMILRGLFTGERLSMMQTCGLGVAVAGLLVLLAPGIAAPNLIGAALMIAAGIAWGIYSLLGRASSDALGTTAGNFLRAAPMSLPLLLVATPHWDAQGMIWATLSGALASGVGYAIWYAALPGLSSTRAATVQLSVPVITALSGSVILGEALTLRLLIASAAVLGGIALVVLGRDLAAGNKR